MKSRQKVLNAVGIIVWDDPDSLRLLTEDEAAAYFPDLAAGLRLHGIVCPGGWFVTQEECEVIAVPR